MTGPEPRDWGALAQLNFGPHACYDATAYAGISFWAKGPGRLFAGARGIDVTPRKWGGTCEQDCYNHHVKKIDLGGSWQRYELLWTQLRQLGYAGKPLDPSELNSLVFAVLAPDTPFDIWIDDVAFTRP